jgi:Bacterial Ig domain
MKIFNCIKNHTIVVALLVLMGCSSTLTQGDDQTLEAQLLPATSKKLIEFGWDIPGAEFVRDNITQMEQRPFNGIVMNINTVDNDPQGFPDFDDMVFAFDSRAWTQTEMKLGVLSAIQWKKFTDNFLLLQSSNPDNMNWFNDQQWTTIAANMKLLSKAVKAMRGQGIFFDTEAYSNDPWRFKDDNGASLYPGKTYAQVAAKAKERGAQFMTALQSEVPNIKIMMSFMSALIRAQYEETGTFENTQTSLLKAFLEGMLGAANPDVRIIDGNEGAYYYNKTPQFADGFTYSQSAVSLIDPALRSKYRQHVRVAQAVYADGVLNNTDLANYDFPFTSQQFAQWWQHNLYHAYATSHTYVWVYGEGMDWWNDPSYPLPGLLPNAEAGIKAVQTKIKQEQPLGFDLVLRDQDTQPTFSTSLKVSLSATTSGSSITMSAQVNGSDIYGVEFYRDNVKVAEDTSAPYSFILPNESKANKVLVARVYSNQGYHGTSKPVNVRISP